jgi:hypothetical protein
MKGGKAALESIEYVEGPLVEMARGQYAQFMQKWTEAADSLCTLQHEDQPAPIDNIVNSNRTFIDKESSAPLVPHPNVIFVSPLHEK